INTSSTSQFCCSRFSQSPRSSIRILLPDGARCRANVPPPAPLPIMITSYFVLILLSRHICFRCSSGHDEEVAPVLIAECSLCHIMYAPFPVRRHPSVMKQPTPSSRFGGWRQRLRPCRR